ncbi:peptidase domain-containing ABC transporter [Ktedonospora formicarum]|uniref:NHLP family bacteriocin export ABC transporter peptidase/permease/ATPase n=1 Tax=Ktedonospora formicarum TaxID=2778364 RepID=A0A8J3I1M4_9CHLR|nr:peptidase domain-containing ABC transporter [Ktedonospora formicarum]GHO48362.1 NHLP family bacteriocin export ABC transporter peptidase/permease/ATPase [Ktedonospora formicarum]
MLRRRVPEIIQVSDVECGAACLAMILAYYGRKTSVSEIRENSGVCRDGLSAWSIVQAARGYGLKVRAISSPGIDFRFVSLPAIVHWQFNHFLVVERWSPSFVDVVDPATGRKRLTAQEFNKGFTGIIIMLEPGVQFDPHTTAPVISLRKYLVQYVKRSPLVFLQIIGASFLLQAFGLVIPLLTKVIVDRIVPYRMVNIISLLGIGLLVVLLSQLVTTLIRSSLLVYLQARIDASIMSSFFEHLLTLPLRFFQQRSSGDILTRVASNNVIRDLISNQLISTIIDGGIVITYLFILFSQSFLFSIMAISIGLLQICLLLGTYGPIRRLTSRELETIGISQGYVAEMLAGMTTLKAAGAEQKAFQRWYNLFFNQLNTSVRLHYLTSFITLSVGILNTLAPLALLWVGAIEVLNGSMQVGTMLALSALTTAFLTPFASLVSSGQLLQTVRSHLERLSDVIEAHPEQDVKKVKHPPRLTGQITLKHVSFRYNSTDAAVLQNINLQIEPGQKIAIVGRTGSGKSTLGKLLLGLCLPTEGEILYDGISLRSLNYQAVRMQFGAVMQDAHIFSGTIWQNITFNHPDIGLEQVIKAAQMAALHDDIMQMPMGYETAVAEGGGALSGGQRQRLAIACALAHEPVVLLLDEATSSLDVVTERIIAQNLRDLQCAQIIIAHRLSTIRNADCIVVLDEGRIVECGSHEELLRKKGHYERLMQSQLASSELKVIDAHQFE